MAISFKKVIDTDKAAHQLVLTDDTRVGEVWREEVNVVVSKLTESRRMTKKWRWFARKTGEHTILGRGTRAAMILGPGFKTRAEALSALTQGNKDA